MTEEQKKIKKYVNAIEWHLKVPLEIKARINSDIGTEIHLRLEAGKTIDEVMAEMGTPKEVAQRFNTELKEQTLRKHPLRFLFLALGIFLVIGIVVGSMNHFCPLTLRQEEISIIGGADGPTSIYVEDAFPGRYLGYWISEIGLCLGCIGAYLLLLYGKQAAPKGCKSTMILSGIGVMMNFMIPGMLQWRFAFGISTIEIAPGFVLNLVVFLIAALRLKNS